MIATALDMFTQHKLYIETELNYHVVKPLTFGRYLCSFRIDGIALEQIAATRGIAVHPFARSAAESDTMNSVLRSSRSSGYLAITAITSVFKIRLSIISARIIAGFTLSYSTIAAVCRINLQTGMFSSN